MFAEFMCITLVVLLLFCQSKKERLGHAMSFETLLESVVIENAVRCSIKISQALLFRTRCVPKVRANDLLLVYCRSTLGLLPVS